MLEMNERYDCLRIAILQRAVKDYRWALRERRYDHISKLEEFFRSEWGQMLSEGYGEFIIQQCKKDTNFSEND